MPTRDPVRTDLANGLVLIHLLDPPAGQLYSGDDALSIPDGVEWHLLTVSFNLTTKGGGPLGGRRLKWVLRDPTDDVNPGRLYSVLADGLGDYVYKDVSMAIGQNFVPGRLGPGTQTTQIRSPSNAGLPDLWVPAGFQWVTVGEGLQAQDQFAFFYALLEERPLLP